MGSGIHNGKRGRRPLVGATKQSMVLTLEQHYLARHLGAGSLVAGVRAALQVAAEDAGISGSFAPVSHPTCGPCILTTLHAASSYCQPVLLVGGDNDKVRGVADAPGMVTPPAGVTWTEAQGRLAEAWNGLSRLFV